MKRYGKGVWGLCRHEDVLPRVLVLKACAESRVRRNHHAGDARRGDKPMSPESNVALLEAESSRTAPDSSRRT